MASDSDDEFQEFMAKVDRVGELVRQLKTAQSPDELENATKEADDYLQKKKSERTKINIQPVKNDNSSSSEHSTSRTEKNLHEMSTEEFMEAVSEDARRRSREKKDRKACSDVFKKEANIAFRSGDYQKALQLYNKAVEQVRDSCVLYTNRALTHLHLGHNTAVLDDCKAALRVNPASLKALVYKARAHRALGQFELAEACTQEAANLHPHHKAFIRHAVLRESISPDRNTNKEDSQEPYKHNGWKISQCEKRQNRRRFSL